MAMLELYFEEVRDLLSTDGRWPQKRDLRECPNHGVIVPNLAEREVRSFEEFEEAITT